MCVCVCVCVFTCFNSISHRDETNRISLLRMNSIYLCQNEKMTIKSTARSL